MAKKEKVNDVNIRAALLKSPRELIQLLTSNIQGLKFTKVLATYVMESKDLTVQLFKEGRNFIEGDLIWLGNRQDNKEGSVLCFSDKKQLKSIIPTNDNTLDAVLDVNKGIIRISIVSRLRCAICGKAIEIFDEEASCPICDAKSHGEHLREWVKMKASCPVCKKALTLDRTGVPMIGEE